MPPRLPLAHASRCCSTALTSSSTTSTTSGVPLTSLFAALSLQQQQQQQQQPRTQTQQTRPASILASLRDNPGAYNKRIRVGRGPSSGKGKTSGRGHKGQGQHGKTKPWFQGGQTPLIFKQGRMGFENIRAPEMVIVNLDRIQTWIDAGRLDASQPITPRELFRSGVCQSGIKDGIKLLARGKTDLRTPLDITVSRASASAIAAVEAAGGKILTRYYTKESIKRLLNGSSVHSAEPLPVGKEHVESALEMFKGEDGRRLYRLPDPTSRWDFEYYRDPAHRGYLSHHLQPGETPSLYFKVPGEKRKVYKRVAKEDEMEDMKLF